jgi:hypothetical protein
VNEQLGWRFPALDDGEREGINDSITKAFSGDSEYFIARECIQNSIDRRVDDKKPVKVVFRLDEYARSVFPSIDELSETIDNCLRDNTSEKAKQELEAIKAAAASPTIRTLTVSDYNTEGLNGSDDDTAGSWHRLVRAVGSNDPSGVGGGSYGLGKGAPFAASIMRTVYYSSMNASGERIFQGKTRLVSHEGTDGYVKRGTGFYGAIAPGRCRSIRRVEKIPTEFLRAQQGTDIIIPAYRAVSDNWLLGMVYSVLKNFWPAIHEKMLEVEIYEDEELKESIGAENLPLFLEIYPGKETGNAYYYFQAKTSPDKDGIFSEHLEGFGEVELYVKRGDKYPKRVQQMRAPLMVVTPELYRRSLLDPFAAVLICRDKDGNDFLKSIEPAQHDKWNPELGVDNAAVKANRILYKSLTDWVRDKLKSLSLSLEGETMEMPGLAEYLASMERDDNIPFGRRGQSEDEAIPESGQERIIPIHKTKAAKRPLSYSFTAQKADTGPGDGDGSGGGSGDSRSGGGKPSASGQSSTPKRSPIRLRNLGMTSVAEFTDVELCLYSKEPFEGSIKLMVAGEDMSTGIRVVRAHTTDGVAYTIKGGRIQNVKIDPSRPTLLTVQLNLKNVRYALGVESYEVTA